VRFFLVELKRTHFENIQEWNLKELGVGQFDVLGIIYF
jgi:hypothetical protein